MDGEYCVCRRILLSGNSGTLLSVTGNYLRTYSISRYLGSTVVNHTPLYRMFIFMRREHLVRHVILRSNSLTRFKGKHTIAVTDFDLSPVLFRREKGVALTDEVSFHLSVTLR
jgi:hypothetical protein